MKIGIITFHRAHNYGAVLQCYALVKTLKALGKQVEVIDYYPDYLRTEYSLFPKFKLNNITLWLKQLIKTLFQLRTKLARARKFNYFINQILPLSHKQYNENTITINGYDIIVFGSDQIWNPNLSNGVDRVFSGFFDSDNSKLISYAASTSPQVLNEKYSQYFKQIIACFDKISTRESVLTSYLNKIKSNVAVTVLDPVLLLDEFEWSKLAILPPDEKYLLIYTVPQSPLVRKHAELVAANLGLKIIELTPTVRTENDNTYRQVVSPQEFLGYFKNASYIVTTSFHGTAFAIKFRKQFSNIKLGSSIDSRAQNLLSCVNLSYRAIEDYSSSVFLEHIDYQIIEESLKTEIKKSISFISQNTDDINL